MAECELAVSLEHINGLSRGCSAGPGARQSSKSPRRMPREFFVFGYEEKL
jgi:hypothetical protein